MLAYIEDSQNVTAVIKIFDMKLSSPSFQSQQITEKKEGPIPRNRKYETEFIRRRFFHPMTNSPRQQPHNPRP